jgi:hypothetical protein
MDSYFVLSLATVLGLLYWWSFLAITALRNESFMQPATISEYGSSLFQVANLKIS